MISSEEIPQQDAKIRRFDGADLALLLFESWKSRRLIEKLMPHQRPASLAEAYDVQRQVCSHMGDPLAGYRIELGSENAIRWTGLASPVLGVIPQSRLFPNESELQPTTAGKLHLEVEIAFIIGGDDDRAVEGTFPILAAHAAIKLGRSRFVDWRSVGVLSHVADNMGFNALVLGDRLDLQVALSSPVGVFRDGVCLATGLTGRDRPDPLAALGVLREQAKDRDLFIRPGTVVTTGGLAADCIVDGPGLYEVRIGDWSARAVLHA